MSAAAAPARAAWRRGCSAARRSRPAFRDKVVFTGLKQPTAIAFSPDGRVFVAEKSGTDQGLREPDGHDPDDLRRPAHQGLQLLGSRPARAGPAPELSRDPLRLRPLHVRRADRRNGPALGPGRRRRPTPARLPRERPATAASVSGRLSRLQASGNVMTGPEQVLIEDWFQQYPSHSIGSIVFGPDGALYATGGDGASFNFADYGQDGNPLNPGGDPPVGVGGVQTPPTAEGGALRSQDLRTRPAHPVDTRRNADPHRSGHRRRPAGQPALLQSRPERAADRRLRPAQPVPHHDPAGHERDLDRRRRLEHLGGDQPGPDDIRELTQLRLALLRGSGTQSSYDNLEPEHLREPLRRSPAP